VWNSLWEQWRLRLSWRWLSFGLLPCLVC
jgi:hypothetical protein